MPLGSLFVRQKLETKNKVSFLFYGPAGSGKTLIVRALAYECDAIVIDLSPNNLEGKYMDKESTKKLIAMAYVVAKSFQPTIIYIDECEYVHPAGCSDSPCLLRAKNSSQACSLERARASARRVTGSGPTEISSHACSHAL